MGLLAEALGLERRFYSMTGGSPLSPQYWVSKMLQGGRESASGERVDESSALTYSAFWAMMNIIAGPIGFLPLMVCRKLAPNRRQEQTGNRIFRLLQHRPNRMMTALTFRETLQGHALTYGNGYAEIERDQLGDPLAMWPLLPDRVSPEIASGKPGQEAFAKGEKVYRYKREPGDDPNWKGPPETYLADEDVFHIHGLGYDGLKGYGLVRLAMESVGMGLAGEKLGARYYANDLHLGGVMEYPTELSEKARDNFKKSIANRHQGLDNASRYLLLEHGITFKATPINANEAQFLESRKFSVAEIARWGMVPLYMLGEGMPGMSRMNQEQEALEFVNGTLMRWFVRWEQEADIKLLRSHEMDPPGVIHTRFMVNALLRGNAEALGKNAALGRQWGWANVNDVRDMLDMPTLDSPAAETYMEPVNMQPLGSPAQPAEPNSAQPKPKGKLQPKDGNNTQARFLADDAWEQIIRREVRGLRKLARKPDELRTKGDAFLSEHGQYARSRLRPALCAAGVDPARVDEIAARYLVGARDAVESIIHGNGGLTVEVRADRVLSSRETLLPASVARRIMAGDIEAFPGEEAG